MAQMTGKLESNADHFPTEKLQMGCIQNRVEGLALSHSEPRTRKNSPRPFKACDDIMEYLEKGFEDPHRVQNAGNKFRALTQGGRSFDVFWAEFLRLSNELNRDHERLISDLTSKFSYDL